MFKFKKRKEEELKIRQEILENRNRYEKFSIQVDSDFGRLLNSHYYWNLEKKLLNTFAFYNIIYFNINNVKDSLIICSYIRQIEYTLEDLKKVYNIDDDYIENVISEWLPILKTEIYKEKKKDSERVNPFFPDIKSTRQPSYSELIDRVEYFLELRRNNIKLKKEIYEEDALNYLKNNRQFNYLLNYLSVKDSLIFSYELNLIDMDISDFYKYDQDYFNNLLEKNNYRILEGLKERIMKIDSIDEFVLNNETKYDYNELRAEYVDIENRIKDTKEYLNSKKRSI